MTYVLTKNGYQVDRYPYSFYQLRQDNPMVSYPAEVDDTWLAVRGIERVQPSTRPAEVKGYEVVELDPLFDNGIWTQQWSVVALPPPSKAELVAHAKSKRYEWEIKGINLGGIFVATDRESQVKITGARVAADANPDWFTVWDAADGNTHMIDSNTMVLISNAVESYVNGCFVVYAGVKADIDNGLVATYLAIDEVFENALA